MPAIGIRELKARTSEILRQVRENRDTFEVTYHGKVIARIVPVPQPSIEEELAFYWKRVDPRSGKMRKYWSEGVSALEAAREQRQER